MLVANQLFATLDPTVRLLRLPEGGEALLVDTVGFIHKLPHGFVDAFKSTLEEVQTTPISCCTSSTAAMRTPAEQMTVVEAVLGELGAGQLPRLTVFNKADLPSPPGGRAAVDGPTCAVSARTGDGLPQLLRQIGTLLAAQQERLQVLHPGRSRRPAGRRSTRPAASPSRACTTAPSQVTAYVLAEGRRAHPQGAERSGVSECASDAGEAVSR